MENCKPVSTPLAQNEKLSKEDDSEDADLKQYRSIIGSLLYLTATRLDMMYAVSMLARFMQKPSQIHTQAIKRVLRYLKGTSDYGIWYKPSKNSELIGYSHSDWAESIDDTKSTSGYVFSLRNGVFSWLSQKQDCGSINCRSRVYCTELEPYRVNGSRAFWQKCVYGYLMDYRTLSPAAIRDFINQRWRTRGYIDLFKMNDLYVFKCSNDEDKRDLLHKTKACFDGALMVFAPWCGRIGHKFSRCRRHEDLILQDISHAMMQYQSRGIPTLETDEGFSMFNLDMRATLSSERTITPREQFGDDPTQPPSPNFRASDIMVDFDLGIQSGDRTIRPGERFNGGGVPFRGLVMNQNGASSQNGQQQSGVDMETDGQGINLGNMAPAGTMHVEGHAGVAEPDTGGTLTGRQQRRLRFRVKTLKLLGTGECKDLCLGRRVDSAGYNQRFFIEFDTQNLPRGVEIREPDSPIQDPMDYQGDEDATAYPIGQIPEDTMSPWEGEQQIELEEEDLMEQNNVEALAVEQARAQPRIEQLAVEIGGSSEVEVVKPSETLSDSAIIFTRWGEKDRRGRRVQNRRFRKGKNKRRFKQENCPLKRKAISNLDLVSIQFIKEEEDDADSLMAGKKKKGKNINSGGDNDGEGPSTSSRASIGLDLAYAFESNITMTFAGNGLAVVDPIQPPRA
uniref:DUF4283 domain-containing protein n=1 Tax=Chenopodium quinoa TaxID=63459 RepID=A0A803N215_CHEQI